MLRTESYSDDASWNAPQQRHPPHKFHNPRRRSRLRGRQDFADYFFLKENLNLLRGTSWKFAPLLNFAKFFFRGPTLPEACRQ
jgi:hypothetical protein